MRDLVAGFIISLVTLNIVMMTETVMRISMLFANVGASMLDMLLVILLVQPQVAVYTLPLALMVSILLTYGRMNASYEIAVLRTSGMSLGSLAKPAFILATCALAVGLLFSCLIGPAGATKTNQLIRTVLSTRAPYAIGEGIFTSAFMDVVIFVEKKPSRDTMQGVFIYDDRIPGRPTVLTAKGGLVNSVEGSSLSLTLTDGSMHIGNGTSATDITFENYTLSIPVQTEVSKERFKTAELTPPEILKSAATMKLKWKKKFAIMEFHRRFTLPLMSICVALFAVPLSFMAGRTGKLGGVGLGFVVLVGFYIVTALMEGMFKSGTVSGIVGGWTPIIALLAFSIYIFRREAAN